MINTPPRPPVQPSDRPRLRAGCPIKRADLAEVRGKRQAMLDRGYRPLAIHSPYSLTVEPANAGKQPLTEVVNGQKQPWRRGHSRGRLMHTTPMSANTGLLLGGSAALVAFDVDPAKGSGESEQRAFMLDVLRALRSEPLWPRIQQALMRLRDPASLVLVLRADRAMPKIRKEGQRGAVELLGEGQHVVVDGWHPRSLEGAVVRWTWRAQRSPWTVPAAELPIVPVGGMAALMQRIEGSGVLGAPRVHPANTTVISGNARAGAYAATARLHALFERHSDLVRPAIRELVEVIGAEGCDRHNAVVAIAGRLVLQRWSDAQACEFLVPLVNQHFGDGDWSKEIEAALAHARKREIERARQMRGVSWR